MLRVEVPVPLPIPLEVPPGIPAESPPTVRVPAPEVPVSPPAVSTRITLREFADRAAGRRFGEKVHRLLEAVPPVVFP